MKIIISTLYPANFVERLIEEFKQLDIHPVIEEPIQLIEEISREELAKYACFKEDPHPYGWYRKFEKKRF